VSVLQMAPSDTDSTSSWVAFGKKIPRSEIVFLCQVLILYTVIVVSIYNLTVDSENSTLWTADLWDTCYLIPPSSPNMFYLTLPSNISMDYFPNNTLASFTTRLPEMLDLDGSWEIELAEIQYPHSWYNVRTYKRSISTFHG
jgi:hypothetical protein